MVKEIKPKISPAGSIEGYSLKKWAVKNKETFKLLIGGIAGLLASSFSDNPIINLAFGAGGAIVTKLAVDAIDFWLTDVKLDGQ